MARILVVDDDLELRRNLAEVLQEEGFDLLSVGNAREALEVASFQFYDLVLLDVMMPGMGGLEALGQFRKVSPRSKVIMVSAFATVQSAVEAVKKGASNYVVKPFRIDELLSSVRLVLEEARLEKGLDAPEFDQTMNVLANQLRRRIIRSIYSSNGIRLMDLARELEIEDHTKVVFHMRQLREAGIVRQDEGKRYLVTEEGKKAVDCLRLMKECLS